MWKGGYWESGLVLSSGGSHFSWKLKYVISCRFLAKFTSIGTFPHILTLNIFSGLTMAPGWRSGSWAYSHCFHSSCQRCHIFYTRAFINWICILSVSLIQPSLSSRPGVEHKTEALWPARLLPKQDGRTADAGWRCINLVHFNIDSIARDVSLKMLCLIREKQRAGDWRTLCGQGELGTIIWILNLQSWRNWS